MKILFLTRLYYPHVGGVEKHIEKVSEIFINKGHKVTVLTTKHERSLSSIESYKKVDIVRFTQPSVKYYGLFYTWYWLFQNRLLIKQSDIVHIHDVFIWYWPFKLIYPKKKVYITFHGQWGKYPISRVDIIQKRLGRYFARGVISIGKYIDKNYGIVSDILSYGAVSLPRQNIVKKENIFLYVGRLDNITGLPTFLKFLNTLKSNNKIKLRIVFCGDGELRTECGLYGEVLGWSDPADYYKKAKYVFASGYLTVLEALINKCLVFTAYHHPLQKDYYTLTPFIKYIYTTSNYTDLTKKFNYLYLNRKVSAKMINDSYKWVQNETWSGLAENYLRLWRN